jgi:hypothetical protein
MAKGLTTIMLTRMRHCQHITLSLESILPAEDEFHQYAQAIALMTKMVANGQTGNKGDQGFYRDTDAGKQMLNLTDANHQTTARLQRPLVQKNRNSLVSLCYSMMTVPSGISHGRCYLARSIALQCLCLRLVAIFYPSTTR